MSQVIYTDYFRCKTMDTPSPIQLVGTDRPGMKVTAITDVKLTNTCLTFIPRPPDEMLYRTIPKGRTGIVEEINSANCRLRFVFEDENESGEQQAIFWIKRRDFDRFFSK